MYVHVCVKLQVLVYNILPPTIARTDYTIGVEKKTVSKLTVFPCCSNGSKVVTNNSNYIRHSFTTDQVVSASTNKTEIVSIKMELFLKKEKKKKQTVADVSHVYMHATWMLCCFHGFINTQTFWKTLTALVTAAWR